MIKRISWLFVVSGLLILVGAGCTPNNYTKEDRQKLGEAFQKFNTDTDNYEAQYKKNTGMVISIFKNQDKTLATKNLEVFTDKQTKKYIWGTVRLFGNGDEVYGQFLAVVEDSGAWNIVYAGPRNKEIPCKDVVQYNFPREILPDCAAPLTVAEINAAEVQKVAHDKERIAQVRALQAALEKFKKDKGLYPKSYLVYTLGIKEYSCLNKDGFGPKGCANAYLDNIKPDPTMDQLTGRYSYVSKTGDTYEIDLFLETNYTDSELSLKEGLLQVTPKAYTSYDQQLQ